ncbi:MAG: HAMP domain-containing histidine kinase [Clostridia bacterium]|nr:HAMP domain-containing histidine kinase [Clostridia bacterium]
MIKKLRRRFVIINMSFIFIILLIAFSFLYFYTEKRLSNESMQILHKVADSGGRTDFLYKESESFRQKLSNYPTFYVNINNYGQINSIVGYSYPLDSIEYSSLKEMVQKVLSLEKQTGDLPGRSLRYLVSSTTKGKVIVFLDTTNEIITLKHLIKNLVVVGVFSLVAFFIISLILARVTVSPVEKSWNQQKQLVADASHELKTPITAIMASADVLLSSPELNDELKVWATGIKDESERMSALVSDMLSVAKTDDARPLKTTETVNLSELAWSTVLPFEIICFEAGRTLETEIDDSVFVKGNLSYLKQLMMILLDNAKKYSFENTVIRFSLKYQGDKAVISVSDRGAVIPLEEQGNIFKRFYRLDKARSDVSGYGLGLAIAKNIADFHSAKINVTSDENETCFSFTMKAVQQK